MHLTQPPVLHSDLFKGMLVFAMLAFTLVLKYTFDVKLLQITLQPARLFDKREGRLSEVHTP